MTGVPFRYLNATNQHERFSYVWIESSEISNYVNALFSSKQNRLSKFEFNCKDDYDVSIQYVSDNIMMTFKNGGIFKI